MTLERDIQVAAGALALAGTLAVPPRPVGLVLFAHGSGSSRFSPRNRFVAGQLHREGLATLLMDLLTADEEEVDARTAHLRFDIELLAGRVVSAVDWLAAEPETRALRIGCFGASTGAAAALVAAARRPEAVAAIVCRGGRPDLAARELPSVRAPTLLIVGANDREVLALNERALTLLSAERRLEVVPGAGHLFEEPGALEWVAGLAAEWLLRHLRA